MCRCGEGLAQLYRSPHVQHFFNSIPMSALYSHKAIHQPYAMRKVCGLSSALVGKITSRSTQNRRGTVLYKDINIHRNSQETVPLSSLTSFMVQESVYSLKEELHVSDALVAQNCNVVGAVRGLSEGKLICGHTGIGDGRVWHGFPDALVNSVMICSWDDKTDDEFRI